MNGPWEMHTKGNPGESPFEICVIRKDNKHGHNSYGWFDENKLLVSHNGGPCSWPVTIDIWNALVRVAIDTAEKLNKKEP